MKNLKQAIASLKLSEKSCREEASGELDNVNRPDGLNAIGDEIAEVRRFLSHSNMKTIAVKRLRQIAFDLCRTAFLRL